MGTEVKEKTSTDEILARNSGVESTSQISSSAIADADEAPIYSASSFSLLPTYDPASHAAKKEKSILRSAENAVHFILLLLIASAVILWFFSDPVKKGVCCRKHESLQVAEAAAIWPWQN
ncbi:hypothetical protein LINPERHAP2_LOCUS15648 [Linum perenne]